MRSQCFKKLAMPRYKVTIPLHSFMIETSRLENICLSKKKQSIIKNVFFKINQKHLFKCPKNHRLMNKINNAL